MLVDTHLHLNPKANPEELIQYMDQLGIDQAWLLSWEEISPVIPNSYRHLSINRILEAYNKYPERFIPFYAPDPSRKDIDQILNKYFNDKIKGCGELKVSLTWDSSILERYLSKLNKIGVTLIFHMEKDDNYFIPSNNSFLENKFAKFYNGSFNGLVKFYFGELLKNIKNIQKKII